MPDSRERRGLGGAVRVTLDDTHAAVGGVFTGEAEVVNTGGRGVRLGFDLVSEQVCWFEMNGSEVALIDVSVRE